MHTYKHEIRWSDGRYKSKPSHFVHVLIVAFLITAVAYFLKGCSEVLPEPGPVSVAPAAAATLPSEMLVEPPAAPTGTTMHVTAYTSRPEETDDTPCIAASGEDICVLDAKMEEGICASNDYPFGTRLRVDGMGVCVVLDRMNKRYTGKQHLDWYFGKDLEAAITFGIHDLIVTKL